MGLLVRRAGRRDLDPIQALWRQNRDTAAKADPRFRTDPSADNLARGHREVILADPRTAFFVAEDRGQVLGYLHAQVESSDPIYRVERYGEIVDLYVAHGSRRQGIGSRLLNYGREWFDGQNVPEIRISTPHATPEAQQFLEKNDASPLSVVHVILISS